MRDASFSSAVHPFHVYRIEFRSPNRPKMLPPLANQGIAQYRPPDLGARRKRRDELLCRVAMTLGDLATEKGYTHAA